MGHSRAAFRIETARLVLRPWREQDLPAYAALCADPEVMAFLGGPQSAAQAQAGMGRRLKNYARDGFCFWAVELADTAAFIGFAGIERVPAGLPFAGVEIGWRLARAHWGRGYASEAASAALADGFGRCGRCEIVSFAVGDNWRSVAVMERIGMRRDFDGDFFHPSFPQGHPLGPHVLYRIASPMGG